MDRIDKIMKNSRFISCMKEIELAEKDRRFCLHGLNHCIDVARICYILCLENNVNISKDVIYATALLHDVGRSVEYKTMQSHHKEGAKLACDILRETGFSEAEIADICNAIAAHKNNDDAANGLSYWLYKADKLSRNCFACKAYDECYWSDDIKNKGVIV